MKFKTFFQGNGHVRNTLTPPPTSYIPPLSENVLSYLTFGDKYSSGECYDYGTKQLIVTPVQRTLENSIDGKSKVGVFPGNQRVLTTISESIKTRDFTQEVWVRIDSTQVDRTAQFFSGIYNGSTSNNVGISIGQYSLGIYIGTSYGNYFNISGKKIIPDQWNHICVQRNSGILRTFLNGDLIDQRSHTSNMTSVLYSLGAYRGNSGTESSRYLIGEIADAALTLEARYNVEGFIPSYPLYRI